MTYRTLATLDNHSDTLNNTSMHNTETPNPIVKRYLGQTLSGFPGWQVVEYADGTFAASEPRVVTDDMLNLDADGEYYDNRAYVNPNL